MRDMHTGSGTQPWREDGEAALSDLRAALVRGDKAEAQRDALLAALVDVMHNNGSGPKSCGHDFTCSCPEAAARAAIAKARGEA
jgi:hypothetical protein